MGKGIRIVKASRCVPDFVVTNDDLAKLVETSDEWIYSRSGIKQRHISKGESVSELAAGVFRGLCDGTGYKPEDIELLILTTVTPDYLTPQASAYVLNAVGARNAFAFDMNAACTGFVFGLSVAEKYLRSGMYKNAMVISADTLSKITDWTDRSTCVLFGDGAGGVLLEAADGAPGILAEDLHADGEQVAVLRGHKLPVRNAWHNDEIEEPHVIMDGRAVFDFALKAVPKSMRAVLEKTGLSMDDINRVVPHQANLRIIEGLAKKFKTDMEKFYVSIHEYGNTSSSSIPIALSEMMEKGMVAPGDRLLFTGFGGGLTWGSVIYQHS